MAFKEFPCGCKIEIVNGKYDLRFDEIDLLCPATWDIFKSGKTKGVFQLERQGFMSSKVEPTCLEHLSDLISVIRPGTKNSFIDGKSLTDHYVERKAGREPVEYLHESLREILQNTQGILTYQEQALQIAAKIAGFSLSEADTLRKAIGKKKADVMAEMKIKFLEGSEKTGVVSKSQAEEIFGWIESSQKYSFNKCLSPSTIVETKNGMKTLEEINIGEYVNSPNGYIEVLDKIDQGDNEVFEIELENGYFIECTLNHKFLCNDGNIRPLYEIIDLELEICHE